MDANQTRIAHQCHAAAYSASMDFPNIIATLMAAGFEGYHVDYRARRTTYYLPDGHCIDVPDPVSTTIVAAAFDADSLRANIRQAQAQAPGYSYAGFCEHVKAAGCAGYVVSFSGRRVLYYGRTGELHVEHFPQ